LLNQLQGTLLEAHPLTPQGCYWVVNVHGLGLEVQSHSKAVSRGPRPGASISLYTQLIIRETEWTLVGFLTREERDMFKLLQSASGVGVKVALGLLECLSVAELAQAVLSGQHKTLTTAKGVGPKLAQKIVLEVKEKMMTWHTYRNSARTSVAPAMATLPTASTPQDLSSQATPDNASLPLVVAEPESTKALPPATWLQSAVYTEAESVLLSLGYDPSEIWESLQAILGQSEALPERSELLLKSALRWLSSGGGVLRG
jgi:holliday junction DNA helicase RuvA